MSKTNNLGDFLTDIANAIRAKKGTSNSINAQNFSSEIASIPSGGGEATLITKNITANGTYTASADNADGYSKVTVNVPIPSFTTQEKTVTPTKQTQEVTPDTGYNGLSKVTVNPIPNNYIEPKGNIAITQNTATGTTLDVSQYATATVNVQSPLSVKFNQIVNRTIETLTANDLAGVTVIGDCAFEYCEDLRTVEIPENITKIGLYAFDNCTSLSGNHDHPLIIPDSVETISYSAFSSCLLLEDIIIGEGITAIGSYAFSNCRSLNRVRIKAITPPTLANINAFGGAEATYPIDVPLDNENAYKSATNWSSLAFRIRGIDFDEE